MNRPWVPAADENKAAIYAAIEPWLNGEVLEIASGSGQHAVHFAALKPELRWQCSDLAENLDGIAAWIEFSGLDNLLPPLALDVDGEWPRRLYDRVFAANCMHIMAEASIVNAFAGVGRCLRPGGVLMLYGPFNYGGEYTADSNARFDRQLRARDPASGIRDFEWLDRLAGEAGLELLSDITMPANNRTLVWQKRT